MSESVFPLFLGTKSLHHRPRLRKSCVGWNQLLNESAFIHPSLVQSQTSDQCIKTVQCPKHFLGGGGVTKSSHHRSRLRLSARWHWSLKGPALSLPSLVQSQTLNQHIKTVQSPKQFFPPFLGTKSLHHRSRLWKSCAGWNSSLVGQLLVTYLLCKVKHLISA